MGLLELLEHTVRAVAVWSFQPRHCVKGHCSGPGPMLHKTLSGLCSSLTFPGVLVHWPKLSEFSEAVHEPERFEKCRWLILTELVKHRRSQAKADYQTEAGGSGSVLVTRQRWLLTLVSKDLISELQGRFVVFPKTVWTRPTWKICSIFLFCFSLLAQYQRRATMAFALLTKGNQTVAGHQLCWLDQKI